VCDIIATVQATHASVLLFVPAMYRALLNAIITSNSARRAMAESSTRSAASGAGSTPLPGIGRPHGRPVPDDLRLAVCGSAPDSLAPRTASARRSWTSETRLSGMHRQMGGTVNVAQRFGGRDWSSLR